MRIRAESARRMDTVRSPIGTVRSRRDTLRRRIETVRSRGCGGVAAGGGERGRRRRRRAGDLKALGPRTSDHPMVLAHNTGLPTVED